MLYVQESLGPNEELIHIGRFNIMYTVEAAFMIVLGVIGSIVVIVGATMAYKQMGYLPQRIGFLEALPYLHYGVRALSFFVLGMGLMTYVQKMIIKMTTEIAITNSRVIYKRGMIARHVGEINVDRIEGITVLQSIMGRIFGYGRLAVRGMGIGEVVLPPIEDPLVFRQAIERAKAVRSEKS